MEIVLVLGFSLGLMVAARLLMARWGMSFTRRIGDANWQRLNENDAERAEREKRTGYRY